jgi:hypothetical protein
MKLIRYQFRFNTIIITISILREEEPVVNEDFFRRQTFKRYWSLILCNILIINFKLLCLHIPETW